MLKTIYLVGLILLLGCLERTQNTLNNNTKTQELNAPFIKLPEPDTSDIVEYSANANFYLLIDSIPIELMSEVVAHPSKKIIYFLGILDSDSANPNSKIYFIQYDIENKKIVKKVDFASFFKNKENYENCTYNIVPNYRYCIDLAYSSESISMILPAENRYMCTSFIELDEDLNILTEIKHGCYFDPYRRHSLPISLNGEYSIKSFYKNERNDLLTFHTNQEVVFFQTYGSQVIPIDYFSDTYKESHYADLIFHRDLENGNLYAVYRQDTLLQLFACNQNKYDCKKAGVNQIDSLLFTISSDENFYPISFMNLSIQCDYMHFVNLDKIYSVNIETQEIQVLKLKGFDKIDEVQYVESGVFVSFSSPNYPYKQECQFIPWKTKNK